MEEDSDFLLALELSRQLAEEEAAQATAAQQANQAEQPPKEPEKSQTTEPEEKAPDSSTNITPQVVYKFHKLIPVGKEMSPEQMECVTMIDDLLSEKSTIETLASSYFMILLTGQLKQLSSLMHTSATILTGTFSLCLSLFRNIAYRA
ncbi:hypothetical protein BLNAU_4627 [Blattamonas nauphoetae]|uniref:Uncharacterized protein n=1 Tax=Blattamonas nauphoetae TaxID=2049346 RepID=A0ABQ9Y9N9_9EUKA|nr:hypothetical protein BLNAU_4627 [Blattamonas nauphoetae]